MWKGFKQFILRGNVIDLAVGVVIGAAFGGLVNSIVKDVLTPLIAAIAKQPDFSNIVLTINGSNLMIGSFLNALISFLIIAIAVYFFVVLPVNTLTARIKKGPIDPTDKKCPKCTSTIALAATKCPFCTADL